MPLYNTTVSLQSLILTSIQQLRFNHREETKTDEIIQFPLYNISSKVLSV